MARAILTADERHIIIECTPPQAEKLTSVISGASLTKSLEVRVRADPSVLPILQDNLSRVVVSKALGEWILDRTAAAEIPALPKNFKHAREGDLRSYQRVGVSKILHSPNVLLADEMGMGKTIQAIVAIESEVHPNDRVLIICPSCIKEQWAGEIEAWGDGESKILRRRTAPMKRAALWEEYVEAGTRYFIIHWEALRLLPEVQKMQWDWVVCDEAHYMKNRKAKRSKAVLRLRTSRRVLLTGSPIINRPDELWMLLHFMAPGEFRSYWRFFEAFVDYIELPFGRKILGARNVLALQKLLIPYMLRRLKADYLTELPEKIRTTIEVPMLSAQERLYKRVRKEVLLEFEGVEERMLIANAAARTMKLQQAATSMAFFTGRDLSGKLDAATGIVVNAVESSECVVVFTKFRLTAEMMCRRLLGKRVRATVYHGGTSNAGLREFLENRLVRVLCCTVDAGGIGLNLQKASTAVFVELPWSPAKLWQAEDRLHRIGQHAGAVNIINIAAKGTVDASVARVLARKEEMVSRIIVATRIMEDLRNG